MTPRQGCKRGYGALALVLPCAIMRGELSRPEVPVMRCDLSGKVSLVTGAARGIGQAIADRLAANGSRVVYSDVDGAGAEAAAARIGGSRALKLDVTQPAEVEAAIQRIVVEQGRLDILVNNAGV